MDSQGANFAFDMNMNMNLNMDFSNVFTKPSEDNTSAGFFGDEGIDATFSQGFDLLNPMLTTTPQEQNFMPQLTMDNTSGSTSMWNGQLTPQSQNALHSFPPTPMQSFDTMFEQPSTLGKRALQLDVEDFPQAKRLHETMDFSLFSPSSSWTLDAQPTPPSAATFGLTDEAADMCAMWFNKYAILPSDRHINSLSQLTGESADAIRHWFGRMLKQGMGNSQGDSAYKSQTAMIPDDQFWNNLSNDVIQMPQIASGDSTQEFTTTPDVSSVQQTPAAVQPANTLRSGKKQRCSPTEDQSLLSRDPEKIYQCTRKCGKRYGRKCDWKRNEEEGYPCKSWVCSLCTGEGAENVKPCFRKYHFAQHFRNIHPGLNCEDYEETSIIASETDFPRQCGFCRHRFQSRQERIDHIADHFKQGKCMLDWNDNGGEDNNNSDNSDDGDDRPSDDGSDDSAPPRQPPQYDPGGAANKKHFGSGNNGGSSGGSGQGGFFQWQLSQLNQRSSISRSSPADQRIKPSEVLQRFERGLRASSEPPLQSSPGLYDEPGEVLPEPGKAEEHDKNTLAGDGVSKPLAAMDDVHGQWYGVRTDVLLNRDLLQSSVPTVSAIANLDQQRERRGIVTPQTQGEGSLANATDMLEVRTTPAPSTKLDYQELLSLKNAAETAASAHAMNSRKAGASNEHSPSDSKILQIIPMASQSFLSLRLLGSGGFSTVDEVVHRDTNLRLGRKTLKNRDPAALKELLKEVNVLQKLRHPHVIRFLGAYSRGDKMSILVSPVADTTLALWLDRFMTHQPENLAHVVTKMFGCLASSVRYLHEKRPVVKHLDIKPQNILVVEGDGEFPHVVLCDFGISSAEELAEEQTQPLTRHYVAPEVFEGFTRKQAADIWSLGCVFVEMAAAPFSTNNSGWFNLRKDYNGKTGKHYWQDVNGLQTSLAQLLEGSTSETEVTTVHAIKSMLQLQPEDRPDATALTLIFTPGPCCLNLPNDKATYPGPHEEMSSADQLNHVRFGQLHQASSTDGDDPAGLINAKEWLQRCSHNHDACVPSTLPNAKTLPTRLIDIRPSDQGDTSVRLVETTAIESDVESVKYVALSHVWSSNDVRLTSDSLEAMQAQIPRELLSEALNAAITTAQGLQYSYIWVDSLCVLQDSKEDKQQECSNMASVFRNASVTMVLDQIDNALQDTQSTSTDGQTTKIDRLTPSAALPALDFTTPGFAWDTRAWALQERLLSTRFLHLGQEQLYWECNSLKASDTFPQGLSSLVWEKIHRKNDDEKDTERITAKKMISNVKHTTMLAERKSSVTDYAKRLGPSRLRDCQWIKMQGDAVGDSMTAAQMAVKTGSDIIANANEEVVATLCHACTACRTERPHAGDKSTAVDMMVINTDDQSSPAPSSTSAPLSSRASSDASNGSARQVIRASGQMDQNGSVSQHLFDDGVAADARIKDDQIRRSIGGAGRTFREDCREIWNAESRFGRSNSGRRNGKGMD